MDLQTLLSRLRPILTSRSPDLHELASLRYELAKARSEALQKLYEARAQSLRPKDTDVTDLDRKTHMEGWTAEKERDRQFIDDLWVIVSDLLTRVETDGPEQSREDTD